VSLTIDDETQTRLERVRASIVREFEELPQNEVDQRFELVVRELLDEATFGDFVPVLAWRYSREELRASVGLPAEFRL
jgi:hypothetical protein